MERFATTSDAALRTDGGPPAILGSRCVRCEREFGRFDTECRTCGNPLDSPEQVAFTQQLAAERAALLEQERIAVEALREARAREDRENQRMLAANRQAIGRELANKVHYGAFTDPLESQSPFPARKWLLEYIPSASQRSVVKIVAAVLSVSWILTGLFGEGGWFLRGLWLVLGGAIAWAFFPRFWVEPPSRIGPPDGRGL